jgi:hypothetical protein
MLRPRLDRAPSWGVVDHEHFDPTAEDVEAFGVYVAVERDKLVGRHTGAEQGSVGVAGPHAGDHLQASAHHVDHFRRLIRVAAAVLHGFFSVRCGAAEPCSISRPRRFSITSKLKRTAEGFSSHAVVLSFVAVDGSPTNSSA